MWIVSSNESRYAWTDEFDTYEEALECFEAAERARDEIIESKLGYYDIFIAKVHKTTIEDDERER